MSKSCKRLLILGALLLGSSALLAQSAPAIFYSDLDSGPNTGGENGRGVWITIYGKGFGVLQGTSTVTVGGGAAAAYNVWSDSEISFQPGSAAQTGNIVVNVNAVSSNGAPFTIRPGNIYFVATTGSDSNNGSFATPWKTIVKAKGAMVAGDTAYIMDGVSQTGLDDYNASLSISSSGQSGQPKALVAYPGATVTIGSATGSEFGLRTPQIAGGPFSYWTIAGFIIRGANEGIDIENLSNWRIIGNDISCPTGDGPTACIEGSNSNNIKFLGNNVHDSGAGRSKLYHSVYFTTNSNHLEIGWNKIQNNRTCRGIQFHSTGGNNQFDLAVHDNLIHGQICDGINFATIDPSKGPVVAYNNIVYSVGNGPDPTDGDSNYACIDSPGITNVGSPGTGTAEIFNNTFYDCGSRILTSGAAGESGAITVQSGSPQLRFRNNIIYARPGEVYISGNSNASLITGSNNLLFGGGGAPSSLAGSILADPKIANLSLFDFHLLAGSPAIDAGTTPPLIAPDLDGNARPQGPAYDIGAYEAISGATRPNPPTNLTVVVH